MLEEKLQILSRLCSFSGLLAPCQIVSDLHGIVHKSLLNILIQLQDMADQSVGHIEKMVLRDQVLSTSNSLQMNRDNGGNPCHCLDPFSV